MNLLRLDGVARRVAGLRQASRGVPMTRAWLGALLAVFAAWLCPAQAQAQALATTGSRAPNIVFHYGSKPPVDALQAFDIAVVEPDSGFDPRTAATPNTQWFSYVSIGEVAPSRAYLKDIPKAWLIGNNDAWGARVVDQAAEGWPALSRSLLASEARHLGCSTTCSRSTCHTDRTFTSKDGALEKCR